jgi:hypothetical protein
MAMHHTLAPALATLALALAAGCSNGVKKMSEELPTCASLSECGAREGQRVTVVGVYTPFSPMPNRKRDDDSPLPVRITLGDGAGLLLEPYWHRDAVRPADEMARHAGKKVRVTGTFHKESPKPPEPDVATLGGPCLHPVEKIEPAE